MNKHNGKKSAGSKGVLGTFLALLLIGAVCMVVPIIMQDMELIQDAAEYQELREQTAVSTPIAQPTDIPVVNIDIPAETDELMPPQTDAEQPVEAAPLATETPTAESSAVPSQVQQERTALRRHIINYMKTREVYVAYRKAGYSKKFLAEHESDILIHKAAKQAFDELHLEKLPTIRSLQNEYAQLESEKKQVFAAYRQAKEDMREMLTAKANVDRMFGYDTQMPRKEKEQGQR